MSTVKIQPWILLTLILCFSTSLMAQDLTDPKTYSNYVLAEQAKIVKENLTYIVASSHSLEIRKNAADRERILSRLDVAIKKISEMPDFEKSTTLKETGLKVFELYKETFALEYQSADSMLTKKFDEEVVLQAYWKELSQAENQLYLAGIKFIEAQNAFAKKYKLEKADSSTCLFSKIAEINNYYRKIYYQQLKLAEVDKDFFSALKRKATEAMESRRNDLVTISAQVVNSLTQINPYEGEKNYLSQARNFANFIKLQAEGEYSKLVAINQKKNATFEDANAFNKIVVNHYRKYKSLVNKLNKAGVHLIQSSLEKRSEAVLATISDEVPPTPTKSALSPNDVSFKAEAKP